MTGDFHKTIMGKKFYENDLPTLIKSITRLSEALEAQNAINEKLLKESKKENAIKSKQLNEANQ
jgi:hypothetical protein